MAEYIEREKIWPALNAACVPYNRATAKAIEDIPAADVRPVVLCRDCKHWEKYDNTAGCGYCNKVKFEYGQIGYVFKPVREPVFFCADGERGSNA